jgi:hypothetical protein
MSSAGGEANDILTMRDTNGSKMNTIRDPGSDVLHDYARLKLDLAAIVRSLLYTAERLKDDISIHDCRRVLARLAEDRFNLAIVGQFSRGKSSLMNALLGSERLPTGILPLTSVITTVTYGETEKVLLQREGWTFPQEIRLDQLAEYVTQGRNPGNEKRVVLAEVRLPNELLRLGVHFVDTPGIASAIAENTKTTRQFLPEADAAVLVTSFESPMTEAEVAFLQEVREPRNPLRRVALTWKSWPAWWCRPSKWNGSPHSWVHRSKLSGSASERPSGRARWPFCYRRYRGCTSLPMPPVFR